ncbi:MAG: alanine racemase [Candidatus Sphingomonas colombiensis]|nr:alanine racemase [Sphingomonas sp.]WEK42910.1 MAG: alanine racemase [Sphingomonas sp.]
MRLEPGDKGLPPGCDGIRLGDVAGAGWSLHGDLQLPAAVLRCSAIKNNSAWMRRFSDGAGVALCPHGKTTMAPQLFDRQLRDGAWGLSCATMPHLRLYRRFGVPRLIYANQIVSPQAAAWLARELAADPGFEAFIFVDSRYGAHLLADAAEFVGLERSIPVLIEVGAAGSRTGVRGVEAALALARAIAARSELSVAGVATFEGIVPGGSDAGMEPNVDALLIDTIRAAEAIAAEHLFDPTRQVILSAGGSRFFDMVARRFRSTDIGDEPLVVLRSGCYISHDAIHYELAFERLLERTHEAGDAGRLKNALEVWAEIQSRPEPGWMFANLGKRDISYDTDLPQLILSRARLSGSVRSIPTGAFSVEKLSDQHAHIAVHGQTTLAIGDQVGFGVSHPCTTFDKWRTLFEVDDDGRVLDAIATFF